MHREPHMRATGRAYAAAVFVLCALTATIAGCGRVTPKIRPTSPAPATAAPTSVVLATTDAVRDSGLADALKAAFQEAYPQFRLSIVAGSASKVLSLGKSGQAGVLLVDLPTNARALVASGEASQSKHAMLGDFVIVGPSGDPASVRGAATAAAAFKAIAAAKATFVTAGGDEALRADEALLWKASGASSKGSWHLSASTGADALQLASEKNGYTLVERATWLAAKSGLAGSAVLVQGDKALADPYDAVLMKGTANPAEATVLVNWIGGPAGQEVIGAFGVVKFGERVFNADAL